MLSELVGAEARCSRRPDQVGWKGKRVPDRSQIHSRMFLSATATFYGARCAFYGNTGAAAVRSFTAQPRRTPSRRAQVSRQTTWCSNASHLVLLLSRFKQFQTCRDWYQIGFLSFRRVSTGIARRAPQKVACAKKKYF